MAFPQFDVSRMLRCSATDDAGFSCLLAPSHDGEHHWNRCETRDPEGHRCMLQIRHPGGHQLPWYDSPAVPGQTHRLNYGGSRRRTEALSDRSSQIASRFGWVRASQTFRPGLLWRSRLSSGWLSAVAEPQGELTVIFEYRPTDSPSH